MTTSTANTAFVPQESTDVSYSWLKTVIPLVVICVFHIAISLTMNNIADHDEALYIMVGRQLLVEGAFGNTIISGGFLSGTPYVYPIIAGLFDAQAGLAGARAFSLIVMLLAICNIYYFTYDLFGKRQIAILGAIVFATHPSIIFMSHYATFDAMALSMLTIAIILAIRASHGKGYVSVILCGLYILLAGMSKYAVLAFAPLVAAVMFWQTLRRVGLARAIFYTGTITIIPLIGIGALLYFDPYVRQGMLFTTTEREAMGFLEPNLMFSYIMDWSGSSLLIAIIALIAYLFFNPFQLNPNIRLPRWFPMKLRAWIDLNPLILVLAISVFIAPVYHLYKAEATSLQKHLGYGFIGGAPIIGFLLAAIGQIRDDTLPNIRWGITLALVAMLYAVGIPQGQAFTTAWSYDIGSIQAVLRSDSRILADADDFFCYNLHGGACEKSNWTSLYGMDYGLGYIAPDGNLYTEMDAYEYAINNGYFDLIIFTGRFEPTVSAELDTIIENSNLYIQIQTQTFFNSGSETTNSFWHIRPEVAAQENRGSLSS